MKSALTPTFLLILVLSFPIAQLRFLNKDPNGKFARFEVIEDKTMIYAKGNEKPLYAFDHVPTLVSNENMMSSYKMSDVKNSGSEKLTFEIGYTLYRQTNKYTGYILLCSGDTGGGDCVNRTEYFEIKHER